MRFSAVVALVLLAATDVAAQARLTGTVRDTAGTALAGAEVSVQGLSRTTTTDRNGAFQLNGIPTGTAQVTVRRLGYAAQTTILKFVDGDNSLGVVVLTAMPRELDTVTTSEQELWREYPLLREFAENKKIGLGQFVTRQQLEMQRGGFMTPIFNQMRGVMMIRSNSIARHVWLANSYVRSANCTVLEDRMGAEKINPVKDADCQFCFPTVFLDYTRLNKLGEAANIGRFNPDMLEGIQVYLGAAETPIRYADAQSGCGVVVFHSRVPDKKARIIARQQDVPTRSPVYFNASVATGKSGGDCTDCGSGLTSDVRLGYTIRDRWVIAGRVANWSGNRAGFQSVKLRQVLMEWYPHPDPGRYKWFVNMGAGTMAMDLFRADGVESADHYRGSGLPALTLGTGTDITLVRRLVVTPFFSYNRNVGGTSDHTRYVTHYPSGITPVTDSTTVFAQPHKVTLLQFGTRLGWR